MFNATFREPSMRTHRDLDSALAAGPVFRTPMRPGIVSTPASRVQRLGIALGSWLAHAVQWLSWRQHVSALQRLDDATLKDIGLFRTQIECYVAEHHEIARASRARPKEDPWVNGD